MQLLLLTPTHFLKVYFPIQNKNAGNRIFLYWSTDVRGGLDLIIHRCSSRARNYRKPLIRFFWNFAWITTILQTKSNIPGFLVVCKCNSICHCVGRSVQGSRFFYFLGLKLPVLRSIKLKLNSRREECKIKFWKFWKFLIFQIFLNFWGEFFEISSYILLF